MAIEPRGSLRVCPPAKRGREVPLQIKGRAGHILKVYPSTLSAAAANSLKMVLILEMVGEKQGKRRPGDGQG